MGKDLVAWMFIKHCYGNNRLEIAYVNNNLV